MIQKSIIGCHSANPQAADLHKRLINLQRLQNYATFNLVVVDIQQYCIFSLCKQKKNQYK